MLIVWGIFAFLTLMVFVFRYSFLFPRVSGIPVLMYHKVSVSDADFLTVTERDFERQLEWLEDQGYEAITMKDFVAFAEKKKSRAQLPKKPLLITFDDGYENNVSIALPILKRMHMSACLFVTTQYIDEAQNSIQVGSPYLNIEQLKTWVSQGMELALHSHAHPNYRQISLSEVTSDLKLNRERLSGWGLPFVEALAYPFGARPKEITERKKLKSELAANQITAAFRIGNRIHSFREFSKGIDLLDICRIDIRGDDPFFEFKIKIRKGRSKVF